MSIKWLIIAEEKKALYSTISDNSIYLAETAAAFLFSFSFLFFFSFLFYHINFTGICSSLLSVWHN